MGRHPPWVRRFLTEAELDAVTAAVRAAEAGTSAEIRVHLDSTCPGDALARATTIFERLGMHRTAARNGILLYVAVEDRKLAVLGDAAIHARVAGDAWARLVETLAAHFEEGRRGDGLIAAVRDAGALLRRHFPRGPDDRNELADEVSLG